MRADVGRSGVFQMFDQCHRVVGSQSEPARRSRLRGTVERGAENAIFHSWTRFIVKAWFICVSRAARTLGDAYVAAPNRMYHLALALRGTQVTLGLNASTFSAAEGSAPACRA